MKHDILGYTHSQLKSIQRTDFGISKLKTTNS